MADRRFIARRLAADLIQRADKLMYEAKGQRARHICLVKVRLENGTLVETSDETSDALAVLEEEE